MVRAGTGSMQAPAVGASWLWAAGRAPGARARVLAVWGRAPLTKDDDDDDDDDDENEMNTC